MGAPIEHEVTAAKPPAHQMADELNELLTRWARTGLVAPPEVADFLMDAQAQTLVLAVAPGHMEQALQAANQLLRHKVYAHVQRMAHLRGPQPEAPPAGKAN